MTKEKESKKSQAPQAKGDDSNVISLLKQIQKQLNYLETKVDRLAEQSGGGGNRERFQRGDRGGYGQKPFYKKNDYSRNKGFGGEGRGERSGGFSKRSGSYGEKRGGDFGEKRGGSFGNKRSGGFSGGKRSGGSYGGKRSGGYKGKPRNDD